MGPSHHTGVALDNIGEGNSDLCLGYETMTLDLYIKKIQLLKPVDTFQLHFELKKAWTVYSHTTLNTLYPV